MFVLIVNVHMCICTSMYEIHDDNDDDDIAKYVNV